MGLGNLAMMVEDDGNEEDGENDGEREDGLGKKKSMGKKGRRR